MNRLDIIREMARSLPGTKEAEFAVRRTFELMAEALKNGEKVSVSGFGTFRPVIRDASRRRNPKTGETVAVGPRRSVRFKVSKHFFE